MEGKIVILGFDKFHSETSNKDFYKARFLSEGKNLECFISKENYDKFSILKLKPMQECIGKFLLGSYYDKKTGYSRLSIELIDIK